MIFRSHCTSFSNLQSSFYLKLTLSSFKCYINFFIILVALEGVMSANIHHQPLGFVSNCECCEQILPEAPTESEISGVIHFFCSTECEKNWSQNRKLKLHDGFTDDITANKTAEISSALFSSYENAFDWSGMDLSVKPGDDFFHYAAGKWIANVQIPKGHSGWGSFYEVAKKNQDRLQELLTEQFVPTCDSDEILLNFYKSYLNLEAQNEAALSPIADYLEKIDSIACFEDVVDILAFLQKHGIPSFFSLWVSAHPYESERNIVRIGQGVLGMGDHQLYIDEKKDGIRKAYLKYVEKIFELSGEGEKSAAGLAGKLFAFEKELAETFMSKENERKIEMTTHLFDRPQLQKTFDFPFDRFFKQMGISPLVVNVKNEEFLKFAVKLSREIESIKLYLRFTVINSFKSALGAEFFQSSFDFYQKTLNGVETPKPIQERMIDSMNSMLGDALGKLYVAKFFSPEKKRSVEEMVFFVKKAFFQRIDQLGWLGEDTKAKAIEKVQAMEIQVAYPDEEHWTDYSRMEKISGDSPLAYHFKEIFSFESQREWGKVEKPVDRREWPWPPQVVNACNMPNRNMLNFPCGILQYPFFTSDPAVNWGAFGMVFCHEMIHSFDDQGRKFDLHGNQADWWSEEDKEKYDKYAKEIVEQFNEYSLSFSDGTTQNVRGELCLGENIADLGGLQIAYCAFQEYLKSHPLPIVNGFTPEQRFFLGYAQVWRVKLTEESEKLKLNNDPHSPPLWRVNGVLSQMPEFKKAFGLDGDCPMVRPEEKRSKMWSSTRS